MPSKCRRLILDNNLILAICKCDCGIFIYDADYVIMDWRTLQRPIVVIMIWSLYGFVIIWRCENDFESYLKHSKPRCCVLRLISHWRCKGTSSKVKPSSWAISRYVMSRIPSSLESKCDWCTSAPHCFSAILAWRSVSWYASFTKKQGGICWHTKLAYNRFARQSGQTGQTCRINRSRQVC